MAFSSTHPSNAYSNQPTLSIAEFQQELKKACDYSFPSIYSKQYRQVKVLLLYWDTDHLGLNVWKETERLHDTFSHGYQYNCEIDQIPAQGSITSQLWLTRKLTRWAENTDEQDLLILYYAGHGQHNKYPPQGHWTMASDSWQVPSHGGLMRSINALIDFTAVKMATLDQEKADVLYLLDSCYSAAAALSPGKELIAATSIEDVTPAPGYNSFTSSIVQELNSAIRNQHYLTASQLWFLLLNDKHRGKLEFTPIHSEAMVGPQPRTSILLAPLGNKGQANINPWPLTNANLTPLGTRSSDLRVMLSVKLRDGNRKTLDEMKEWVTTQRPQGVEDIGISFVYIAPSSSIILVFIIPAPAYYCLASHEAISFMSYVRWPEPPQQQGEQGEQQGQPAQQQGQPARQQGRQQGQQQGQGQGQQSSSELPVSFL